MPSPLDGTDEAWAIVEPLRPGEKPGGRPQDMAWREIVTATVSVLRRSCPWRMIPHDVPCWFTAAASFRRWKRAGIWETVETVLRKDGRVQMRRDPEPSAAMLDRPSITTRSVRGDERGDDAGKSAARFAAISINPSQSVTG